MTALSETVLVLYSMVLDYSSGLQHRVGLYWYNRALSGTRQSRQWFREKGSSSHDPLPPRASPRVKHVCMLPLGYFNQTALWLVVLSIYGKLKEDTSPQLVLQ